MFRIETQPSVMSTIFCQMDCPADFGEKRRMLNYLRKSA
jgi:hypothetical protein